MIKLIIGKKGSGKTKTLIEMVNNALSTSKGSVVCIEKGDKLKFDINYKCRLIDTEEYNVDSARSLYGFIAGILASNHDVSDLFVDSALKICNEDRVAFEKLVLAVDELCSKMNVNVVMTSSLPVEEASDTIKKYL